MATGTAAPLPTPALRPRPSPDARWLRRLAMRRPDLGRHEQGWNAERREMAGILFCNIGWMSRYEGNKGQPDKTVGGGSWVRENETGHEVCNFVTCPDGFVYGHVETIQGERDRKIRIETLGGNGDSVDGVDVVWTAADPKRGGRRVVGWYRNATVFRERQYFEKLPTRQHDRDDIRNYRIRARAEDAHCIDLEDRTLRLGSGPGWIGQTPWKLLSKDSSPDIRDFLEQIQRLLEGAADAGHGELPADEEYQEGSLKLKRHLQRERFPGLADRKKEDFRARHGKLYCERCELDPVRTYGAEYGAAVIEVHHAARMVGEMDENHRTKLDDLQCLCANCHRLTHAELRHR